MLAFPKVDINFLLNCGGIGDNIAALPAMKYVMDHYPWVVPYLYVPDYFVPIVNNILPDFKCYPFSSMDETYDNDRPARQTNIKVHNTLSTHVVDFAFHTLANKQVPIQYKNYLKLNLNTIEIFPFELPKEYVVITTAYTAPIRKFPAKTVNSIVNYLIDKEISVVFLGQKEIKAGIYVDDIKGNFSEEIDYTKGIDLIDKTTLLEAGKIIANAKAIVGIDNGLMHLAGCTDVPIIGGFTSVSPMLRVPYRNNELGWNCYTVTPPDTEPEKFMQSRLDFVYNHYMHESILGNDNLVNSLKAEKFIEQLEKVCFL